MNHLNKLKQSANLILVFLFTGIFLNTAEAQVTVANQAWKTAFPNKPDFLRYATPNGGYIIGTSKTDAAVIDARSGSLLWQANFESKLGTKKCDLQQVIEDAGVLLVYRKKGNADILHVLDLNTGEELWQTERFENLYLSSIKYISELSGFVIATKSHLTLLDARTGVQKWENSKFTGSVAYLQYNQDRNDIITLNYKTSWGALLSGYKNQIMSIDAGTGKVNWEEEYFGVLQIHPTSGRPVFDIVINKDYIYVMIMGLQVLDRNTGKEIWKTDYDLFDSRPNLGAPGYTYTFKGVAYPLIVGEHVYLVYNKPASKKVKIKKFECSTGNMLWEYDVEGRNNPVPTLKYVDGKIIAQMGGLVNIVGPQKVGESYITVSNHKWVGNFGVLALDAESGTVVWNQKKLSKRITNIVVNDSKVIFADAKNLYELNVSDGKQSRSVGVKTIKSGAPLRLIVYKENLYCLGEGGMGNLNLNTLTYVSNAAMSGTTANSEMVGEKYVIKGKKQLHVLDMNSGKISATYKYSKSYSYNLINNGSAIVVTSKKEAMRFNL
jgi:outer membrane protein assembly factor BamB